MVILGVEQPEEEVKALLRKYTSVDASHVKYLQGSPLAMRDRNRAAVSTASAAFVLANKQSEDPVEEDENTILTGLALKQHLIGAAVTTGTFTRLIGALLPESLREQIDIRRRRLVALTSSAEGTLLGSLRPFLLDDEDRPVPNVLLQLIQPHNAQSLNEAPPLDTRVDHVIRTTEISCSLLGLATLYPGLTTLVSNLLSSPSFQADVRCAPRTPPPPVCV